MDVHSTIDLDATLVESGLSIVRRRRNTITLLFEKQNIMLICQIRDFWLIPLVEIESNNDLLLIGSRNLGSYVADRGHADAVMISNAMFLIDLQVVPNAAHMARSGFVQIVGAKSKPRVQS